VITTHEPGTGQARRWRQTAVLLALLTALQVCGYDGRRLDGPGGGGAGQGGSVAQPEHGSLDEARGRSSVYALITQAERTGDADIATMDAAEYHDLVASVTDLVCCIRQVVSYLLDINPSWLVDQATVESYLRTPGAAGILRQRWTRSCPRSPMQGWMRFRPLTS
jgi:hypothetical protein